MEVLGDDGELSMLSPPASVDADVDGTRDVSSASECKTDASRAQREPENYTPRSMKCSVKSRKFEMG